MPPQTESLTIALLEWIAQRPRTYAQAMEAWRSTCPRLTIWEDALAAGLIEVEHGPTQLDSRVSLTARGRDALNQSR